MDRESFIENATKIKDAILKIGGSVTAFEIGEPTTGQQINHIQNLYQTDLPEDFIDFCTSVSGAVNISWSLFNSKGREINEGLHFVKKLCPIYSGAMNWNIESYLSETERNIYSNPCNDPELIGKLHLFDVPNGDMVMFDLSVKGSQKPVVYLKHDEICVPPLQLAPNFELYIKNLLAVGLVGSEWDQIAYFIDQEKQCIDPTLPSAQEWRQAIGLC